MLNPTSLPKNIFISTSILGFIFTIFPETVFSTPVNLLTASPTRTYPQVPTVAQSAPEFSDVGRPRRRRGGGSRGSCLIANKPPLTALVPESSTGFTLALSPSLWFYLPYDLTAQHSLEFVLKDSQDELVYRKTLAGSETTPGIVNFRLPASVTLDTTQSYEWYLLVQCDSDNQERFVFVNGAIRRLERPELQQQLETLPMAVHSNVYAGENIWYDALDTIATQLQDTPQDEEIRTQWTQLLDSIGLTELAAEPIETCCLFDRELQQ